MTNENPKPPPPRKVEIVDSSYQPIKAEVEEVLPPLPDLYPAISPEDVARAIVDPVEITYIPRPRK